MLLNAYFQSGNFSESNVQQHTNSLTVTDWWSKKKKQLLLSHAKHLVYCGEIKESHTNIVFGSGLDYNSSHSLTLVAYVPQAIWVC